jgi:hypothetical protein
VVKTLIFCTSYAPNPKTWRVRHRRWLDAILQSGMAHDQILIVDDGSPYLPDWPELAVVSSADYAAPEAAPEPGGVMIYHFAERLGRPSLYDFPGWHRSFTFAVLYAQAHGFGRVIHIESDAFLLTARLRAYLGGLEDGWVALFCAKYDFPEIAIQAAAGDGLARMAAWAREPYANMVGKSHEKLMPYTKVENGFVGDRYGEHLPQIPRNVDYAAQVEIDREPDYYWWMAPDYREPDAVAVAAVEIGFGSEGNGAWFVGEGWSYPEDNLRWMIGGESVLRLPRFTDGGRGAKLSLHVMPHIYGEALPRQRLGLRLDGVELGEFELTGETMLACQIPAGVLRENVETLLVLRHPDATAPMEISSNGDARKLAVAVLRAWVSHV